MEDISSLTQITQALARIQSLHEDKTVSLPEALVLLTAAVDEIRGVLARKITPILRQHAGEKPASLEERRQISDALNILLEAAGLSIKSPTSDGSAKFAVRTGIHSKKGQFHLDPKGRLAPSATSAAFPEIELILTAPHDRTPGRKPRSH